MNTGCNISILILLIALGKSHKSWHIIAFKEFRIKYICKLLEKSVNSTELKISSKREKKAKQLPKKYKK